MDRRTAIATARTTARRIGTLSGKVALRMGREVTERLAARRANRSLTTPTAAPPPRERAPVGEPVTAPPRRGPTPADVARAVQRNAAGLSRSNPRPQRAPRRPHSAPGDKLPARAGRGILGV